MAIQGKTNPDEETLGNLLGQNGPLAAGAMPMLEMGHVDGEKNMSAHLSSGDVQAAPKKRVSKSKKGETEEVEPQTPRETFAFIRPLVSFRVPGFTFIRGRPPRRWRAS